MVPLAYRLTYHSFAICIECKRTYVDSMYRVHLRVSITAFVNGHFIQAVVILYTRSGTDILEVSNNVYM